MPSAVMGMPCRLTRLCNNPHSRSMRRVLSDRYGKSLPAPPLISLILFFGHSDIPDALRKPSEAGASLPHWPVSPIAVVRELFDVVHQAIQLLLRARLGAPAQREAIRPLGCAACWRTPASPWHALNVDAPAMRRVDGVLHRLTGRVPTELALDERRRLARRCSFGMCRQFDRSPERYTMDKLDG